MSVKMAKTDAMVAIYILVAFMMLIVSLPKSSLGRVYGF